MHQRREGRVRLAQAARFFAGRNMRRLHLTRRATNKGQRIGHDIRQAHAAALSQGVARTCHKNPRLRAQLFHHQGRITHEAAQIHNADGGLAFQDCGGHFRPIGGNQPDPCIGKGGQRACCGGQAQRLGHIGTGNHIQIMGLRTARFRQVPVQPFQTVQNGAALGDDGAAQIGGNHAAPAAFKQLAAQPRFQPRECAGHGRLGNAQYPCGAHQAAMIVNCLDQPKLSNLNHISPVEF